MLRTEIAAIVARRLREEAAAARACFGDGKIGYFVVDDVLPAEVTRAISGAFPERGTMTTKSGLRERKAVTAQMSACAPLVSEAIYAFQRPDVIAVIGDITGISGLAGDPHLYAGGISAMQRGDFLRPHLDNSHDKDRKRWRALNLLFYVTPDWPVEAGGNLELWPDGVAGQKITIHSRFNRLVVMATHGHSWHSVSPVTGVGTRRCVSNYYFTDQPMRTADRFHVTSFRSPATMVDAMLRLDTVARSAVRTFKPLGIVDTKHINVG